VIAALLSLALDARVLGGVVCAEARGLSLHEQLAVAQVAVNRARAERKPLRVILSRSGQWAGPGGCPKVDRRRFTVLARRFLAGRLKPPRWALRAQAFVAPRALARVAPAWKRRGYQPIAGTRTTHTFWRLR
jgi:hypothetical protein